MTKIHLENWNLAYFKNDHRLASISIGGDWDETSSKFIELFFVNETDQEFKQLFQQKIFNNLQSALDYLNLSFESWELVDKLAPTSGCSTCSAH